MTRAGVMSVMSAVMRRSPSALSESVMLGMGALKPLIAMFDHPIIPLINKADAAGEERKKLSSQGCHQPDCFSLRLMRHLSDYEIL